MAVRIDIQGNELVVTMSRSDVLWSLKRRVAVPLDSIVDIHVEQAPRKLRLGIRWPGSWVPGLLTAGTFYGKLGKSFVNVRRGPAVAIELHGAPFDRIVVDVPDAQATASSLRRELDGRQS